MWELHLPESSQLLPATSLISERQPLSMHQHLERHQAPWQRRGSNNNKASSLGRQLREFTRAYLHLKAWRFLFLIATAVPLISSLYLPIVFARRDLGNEPDLQFYRQADFTTAWQLVASGGNSRDGPAAAAQAVGLADSGSTDWPRLCYSVTGCAADLFRPLNETLAARIQAASSSPAMLECYSSQRHGDSLACSLLYQPTDTDALATSTQRASFRRLNLFRYTYVRNKDITDRTASSNQSLSDSELADIQLELKRHLQPKQQVPPSNSDQHRCSASNKLYQTVVAISFSISTTAIIFYFTATTLACIGKLKTGNFMQHQIRSGMSATAYWLPVWSVTLAECLLLSTVFVAAQILRCPDFVQAGHLPGVFAMFLSYCLTLAALGILAATVQTSLNASCMLMLLLNVCLIAGFAYAPVLIGSGATGPLFAFPPISTLQYLVTYMAFDARVTASKTAHFDRVLPWAVATPALLAAASLYLDFVLPGGNGLCLPVYFPLARRFWLVRDRPAAVEDAETTVDDEADEYLMEPAKTPGAQPSVALDRLSVVYNAGGGCCGPPCCPKRALKRVSGKIYAGQITWLVGPSGSGKSTLLSALCGNCGGCGSSSSSSGGVTLLGCRATSRLDWLGLRQRVGVCWQADGGGGGGGEGDDGGVDDPLRSCGLTVLRCLALADAARADGSRLAVPGTGDNNVFEEPKAAPPSARDLLGQLGLVGVEDLTPADLSPGQRRLLAVGLALIGRPQLVLLDEPARGLEPSARQRLWRLLRDVCGGGVGCGRPVAVVVAAALSVDEEAMGPQDRVFLLSGGRVVAAGSPSFLWRGLGCGHRLTAAAASAAAAAAAIETVLRRPPPGARVLSWRRQRRRLRLRLLADSPESLADWTAALEAADAGEVRLSRPRLADWLGQSGSNGADGCDSGNNNNNSNSSSSDSGKPLRPRLERRRFPAAADTDNASPSDSRLEPSAVRRLHAICQVQLRRQLRCRAGQVGRMVLPALLLAALAVLTVQARANGLRRPPLHSKNSTWTATSGVKRVVTICVQDGDEVSGGGNESSVGRAYRSDCRAPLRKPRGQSLADFLTRSDVVTGLLLDVCGVPDNSLLCVVVHAGGSNTDRDVTVGTLEAVDDVREAYSHNDLVSIYRRTVLGLADHFGAQHPMKEPEFAYSIGASHCTSTETVALILFATLFSVFPASFLLDPSDDMETRVYQHLVSMGMSSLAYWLNTFVIHWCQYAVYFAASICLLEIWDQFRNPHYLCSVCLPVLILGTASNQLSAYTTAAMSRRRSSSVTFSYYCLSAMAAWALHGVARLGSIPVLAMIWLVPQAAPLALLLFGAKFAGQRTLSGDAAEEEFVYTAWDMRSAMWSNVFVVNALAAMPVHVVLLAVLLAALEGDCSGLAARLSGIFRGSSSTTDTGSVGTPLTASTPSGEELPMVPTKESASFDVGVPRRTRAVLEVRDLWRAGNSRGLPGVKGVTFEVAGGELLTLVGSAGCGKSTVAASVAGQDRRAIAECRVACGGRLCSTAERQHQQQRLSHDATCGAVSRWRWRQRGGLSAVYNWLTVLEQVDFCARVRGVPRAALAARVHRLLGALGLWRLRRRPVRGLGPEHRRRLGLALALLSSPRLLVWDGGGGAEDFGDMGDSGRADDKTVVVVEGDRKSTVRRALRRLAAEGRAVLATSEAVADSAGEDDDDEEDEDADCADAGVGSSNEEVPARAASLSTRIGVMHRGRLVALGSPRQLRKRFGDWYTLDALVDDEAPLGGTGAVDEGPKRIIEQTVLFHFRGSYLLEDSDRWLRFCVPRQSFGRLSDALLWLTGHEVGPLMRHFDFYQMRLDTMVLLHQLCPLRPEFSAY